MSTQSRKAIFVVTTFTFAALVMLWWICYKYLRNDSSFVLYIFLITGFLIAIVSLIFNTFTDDVDCDHVAVLLPSGRILEQGFHVHFLDLTAKPPLPHNPCLYHPPPRQFQVNTILQTFKSGEMMDRPRTSFKLVVSFFITDALKFVQSEQNPYSILENASRRLAREGVVQNRAELDIEALNQELEQTSIRVTKFAAVDRWLRIKVQTQ